MKGIGELAMRSVMTTSIAVNLNTTDDQSFAASGTSDLAASVGPVSLTLNSDRKDDNLYHAWYNRNLTSSTGTVSGNITWGYDSKSHFESGSNANLTVYSAYSSHNEYFTGDRSQTLIANSSWSQVNGGVPFGTSFGSLVAERNYRGGTSEIWNGYGGFASTYCGTESQSWNDPSIASYDARNLNGTRFTPHNPPGVPAPYPFSTTSKTFVMPPSLVEDAEAAAVEKGEESAIGRFLWSLVPGSSLVGAYRDYQKGSYVSAALNGLFGLADLATVGSLVKARSGLKLLAGFMKVRVKDALADEAANQAGIAVAERLGPEAGFVTQIIVSATLSKNVSQQNKTQLGFANNGSGNDFQKAIQIPKSLPDRLVISGKSLGKKMKQRVLELGLDPSDPDVRQKFRSRIDRIFLNTDEKRANFYRGQGKNGLEGVVLFYRRGHDVLVLSLEGNFITLLVGGVNSQRWISGVVIP